jgi:very-short-patch-repair endonuclease
MSEFKKFDFRKIETHARELRINMTESEKLLWNELRGKKVSGYRFLRQHPSII